MNIFQDSLVTFLALKVTDLLVLFVSVVIIVGITGKVTCNVSNYLLKEHEIIFCKTTVVW